MIANDFEPKIAAVLNREMELFEGYCCYDEKIKKIVYANAMVALFAYGIMQCEEMSKHKWIEGLKQGRDPGNTAIIDWIRNYAEEFSRIWRKTHTFVRIDL